MKTFFIHWLDHLEKNIKSKTSFKDRKFFIKQNDLEKFNYPRELNLQAINLKLTISYENQPYKKFKFVNEGSRLRILGPINKKTTSIQLIKQLEDYLKQIAKPRFLVLCKQAAEEIGVKFNRLSIRGQKTRWGSCSSKGNLNLNYKLLFLKPEQLNYVIYHELIHLIHFNHSKQFWNCLSLYLLNARKLDKSLKYTSTQRPF